MKTTEPVAKQTNENLLECLNAVCAVYSLCGRPRSLAASAVYVGDLAAPRSDAHISCQLYIHPN
jgi:hypothetical protein